MEKNHLKLISSLLLLLTAVIWGVAFVAQSVGAGYVGPWTFVFSRYVLSTLVLLPVTLLTDRRAGKTEPAPEKTPIRFYLLGGAACGLLLGIASSVFTAVTFTRMLVAGWMRRNRPTDIHI